MCALVESNRYFDFLKASVEDGRKSQIWFFFFYIPFYIYLFLYTFFYLPFSIYLFLYTFFPSYVRNVIWCNISCSNHAWNNFLLNLSPGQFTFPIVWVGEGGHLAKIGLHARFFYYMVNQNTLHTCELWKKLNFLSGIWVVVLENIKDVKLPVSLHSESFSNRLTM